MTRIDLNLLRALLALIEERSVTRAAERLFITQSAMSKSLQRLRELLDDPLFVPSRQGLLPTTRSIELAEPLRKIFEQVESCLAPPQFDPALVHGRIYIATPEQFALVVIPQLLTRLRRQAPNLILESLHLMDDHLGRLAAGTLDFVINLDRPYPEDYLARRIYSASPTVWCRKGHPLANKQLINVADICAYPQIRFHQQNLSPDDLRIAEHTFAQTGIRTDVMLDTSHLLIALDVLANTDAMLMAPDYLSRLSILQDAIVPHSINHIPAFEHQRIHHSLVQHKRTAKSLLHHWIAGEIANSLSTTTARKWA